MSVPRLRALTAGFTLVVLACAAAQGRPASSPGTLVYFDGTAVRRMTLDGFRNETVLAFTPDEAPADWNDSIRYAAGTIAWLPRRQATRALWTFHDGHRTRVALDSVPTGISYDYVYGDRDSIVGYRLIWGHTWLTGFRLDPTGRTLIWNVNTLEDISSDGSSRPWSATGHKQHVVMSCTVDGRERRRFFEESFDVPDFDVDSDEVHRFLGWSGRSPSKVFYFRRLPQQLQTVDVGLYALDVGTGRVDTLETFHERVLGWNEDASRIVLTPNDETCCAGSNYTNNTVHVWDRGSARSIPVLDEWALFGNIPDDSLPHGSQVDFQAQSAAFSSDGRRLALSIERWDSSSVMCPSDLVIVQPIDSGGPGMRFEDRVSVGWINVDHLLLGHRRPTYRGGDLMDSLFVLDVSTRRQRPLAVRGVLPLAIEP